MKVTDLARGTGARRGRGRAARVAMRNSETRGDARQAVRAGVESTAFNPLSGADLEKIHAAALDILEDVGIADASDEVIELACARGCFVNDHGRLSFPKGLVEDLISKAAREYVIYSRNPAHADLHVGGSRVHYATSGEAVTMLDVASRSYRPSTLQDLYDCARVVDRLENIHQFGQTVVPTDLDDLFEHDINVVYTCLSSTEKPIEHTFNTVNSLAPALEMYDMVAGGEGKFAERPFASFGGCPIVSPLRFAEDNLAVLVESSRRGLINDIAIAPQAGATSPAYLAGSLVQVVAEGLACLSVVNMVREGCPMSFAIWPFAVDLRTGGSVEVAPRLPSPWRPLGRSAGSMTCRLQLRLQ